DGGDDFAVVHRDAAIDDAAADFGADGGLIDFRIPTPALFAGAGVDGVDDAPVGDAVDGSVVFEGSTFLIASAVADVVGEGEAELADVRGVDQVERAVAGFAGGESVADPVLTGLAGVLEGGVVDTAGLLGEGEPSCSHRARQGKSNRQCLHGRVSQAHRQ